MDLITFQVSYDRLNVLEGSLSRQMIMDKSKYRNPDQKTHIISTSYKTDFVEIKVKIIGENPEHKRGMYEGLLLASRIFAYEGDKDNYKGSFARMSFGSRGKVKSPKKNVSRRKRG